MKAKIRNTEIYYDITGLNLRPENENLVEYPVLFCIHGGPGADHSSYKTHSLALSDSAQLVMFDQRGTGRSLRKDPQNYTMENNIEDMEALRKHLGLDKICVIGNSYGGMVAQGYALKYQAHIDKLILVSTTPSYKFIAAAKKNLRQLGTAEQIKVAEKLWHGDFKTDAEVKEYLRIMNSMYSLKSRQPGAVACGCQDAICSHECINRGFGDYLRCFDYVEDLNKIKVPTLVLAGRHDWICQLQYAKLMADNIPNARLEIFEDSGHSLVIDENEKYIATVRNFLRA